MRLKKTFKNSFYLYLNSIFNSILGFLFFLVIAKAFSLEEMNSYSAFINTLLFLLVFLDFGIYNYTWNYISKGKNNVFTPLFLYLIILALFSLVSIIFKIFDYFFLAIFSFAFFAQLLRSIIYGKQRMDLFFITEFLPTLLKLILAILFYNSLSLETIKLIFLITFSFSFLLKAIGLLSLKIPIKKEFYLPNIFALLSAYLLILAPAIYNNLSLSLISSLFEIGSIIYFGFSISLPLYLSISPLISGVAPILTSYRKNSIFSFFFNLSNFLILIVSIFLILFLDDLINAVNKSYLPYKDQIILIIFSSIFLAISNVLETFLFVTDKNRQIIVIEFITIALLYSLLFSNPIFAFLISSIFKLFSTIYFSRFLLSKKAFISLSIFSLSFLVLFFSQINLIFKSVLFLSLFLLIRFIFKKFNLIDKEILKKLGIPKFLLKIILKIF